MVATVGELEKNSVFFFEKSPIIIELFCKETSRLSEPTNRCYLMSKIIFTCIVVTHTPTHMHTHTHTDTDTDTDMHTHTDTDTDTDTLPHMRICDWRKKPKL